MASVQPPFVLPPWPHNSTWHPIFHRFLHPLLHACAVQVSQGVKDHFSNARSSGSLPIARWFQLALYVLFFFALHCFSKNAFISMCLVLRVEPLRWIMLMAAAESQQSSVTVTAFGSKVSRTPNSKKPVPQLPQFHSFARSRQRSDHLSCTIGAYPLGTEELSPFLLGMSCHSFCQLCCLVAFLP